MGKEICTYRRSESITQALKKIFDCCAPGGIIGRNPHKELRDEQEHANFHCQCWMIRSAGEVAHFKKLSGRWRALASPYLNEF
jgi:hypothetical protein